MSNYKVRSCFVTLTTIRLNAVFSISKDLCEQNIKVISMISKRFVADHVNAAGGGTPCSRNKEVVSNCISCAIKIHAILRRGKADEASLKRKSIEWEISELKAKQRLLQRDVEVLQQSAN